MQTTEQLPTVDLCHREVAPLTININNVAQLT